MNKIRVFGFAQIFKNENYFILPFASEIFKFSSSVKKEEKKSEFVKF